MQFAFSLATGIVYTLVAFLELTSVIPEPFWFSPIRTAFMASIGITGIVMATMHYAWQLWFARVVAVSSVIFLALAYKFSFLPENQLRLPTLVAMIIWTLFACLAGYEKRSSKV